MPVFFSIVVLNGCALSSSRSNLENRTRQKKEDAPETPALPVSPYWSPYFVGASIGVLSWLVFAVVNQPLGVESASAGGTSNSS